MRPLRLLLSLAFFIIATTLLLVLINRRPTQVDASTQQEQSRFSALFSFHTPLFPPSAIISLTDDNSTFFLSRPAAFGPLLPSHGLSGQLWIGSGFGDDSFGRSGLQAGAEGELGCSDVPGWDATAGRVTIGTAGGNQKHQKAVTNKVAAKQGPTAEHVEHSKRDNVVEDVSVKNSINDDGTDDHLHSPSPGSDTSNIGKAVSNQQHADIESLQETAEIAGKIVLLSRGGCGFLEKVKWAQRRGGIALIVGDDIVGGPLVTMYAKGDTSNVTIPALFTSHTTAHLLSSLIPPHGFMNGRPISYSNEATVTEKQVAKGKGTPGKYSKPESATSTSRPVSQKPKPTDGDQQSSKGWFSSLFGWMSGAGGASSVSRRPPSSGHLEWVRIDEFHDDQPKEESKGKAENSKGAVSTSAEKPKDDFVIGVQDWRDPDVLKPSNNHEASMQNSQEDSESPKKSDVKNEKSLKGGSITPGSGEYEKPGSSRNVPGNTKPPAVKMKNTLHNTRQARKRLRTRTSLNVPTAQILTRKLIMSTSLTLIQRFTKDFGSLLRRQTSLLLLSSTLSSFWLYHLLLHLQSFMLYYFFALESSVEDGELLNPSSNVFLSALTILFLLSPQALSHWLLRLRRRHRCYSTTAVRM